MKNAKALKAHIERLVVVAGEAINKQLMYVSQDPVLSQLQTTWRGIHYLTAIVSPGRNCLIRVLDLTMDELAEDIKQSAALQYTLVYNLVYHRELDTQGGTPFGMLIVDFPVNPLGKQAKMHIYLLSALAHIGKSALCPVICPMDEQWLEPETDRIAFLEERLLRIYNSLSLSQYRQLRDQPHSLYLGIVWPGAYLINKDNPSRYHKISGAICLAACVIKEFDLFSWFAGLQCWGPDEVGGAILPITENTTLRATWQFSESLDQFYSRLGIMLLSSTWLEGLPGLFTQSMFHRFSKDTKSSQQDAGSEEPLSWLLIACRVAHHMKAILRENIGQTLSHAECKQILDKWIQKYCLPTKILNHEMYCKFPFSKATVHVTPSPFDATKMAISLHLTPNLPPGMVTKPLALKVMHKKGSA